MTESTPLLVQRRMTNPESQGLLPQVVRQPTKQQRTVLIDENGIVSYTSLKKHALVADLNLRHRDIRALEPDPAAIFVRKSALILNLEGLKMIITKDKTLVISVPQVNDLAVRTLPEIQSPVVVRLSNAIAVKHPDEIPPLEAELQYLREQPYELRALEAALHLMVSILAAEVTTLEGMTIPVLARIRRHVERNDLEQLYDTQNKLNKTMSRVTKIKEELEELLDSPEEMEGMCLSRAEQALQRARSGVSPPGSPTGQLNYGTSPAMHHGSSSARNSNTNITPAGQQHQGEDNEIATTPNVTFEDDEDDELAEVEDMLEAHWLQVDSILSRLTILTERITNTEHLVNLDLDAKRNSLVALGLLTDLLLLVFEAHMTVTSIFGMNLTSGLEPYQPYSLWGIASFGVIWGSILAITIYRVAKNRGLLILPSFGLTPRSNENN